MGSSKSKETVPQNKALSDVQTVASKANSMNPTQQDLQELSKVLVTMNGRQDK